MLTYLSMAQFWMSLAKKTREKVIRNAHAALFQSPLLFIILKEKPPPLFFLCEIFFFFLAFEDLRVFKRLKNTKRFHAVVNGTKVFPTHINNKKMYVYV